MSTDGSSTGRPARRAASIGAAPAASTPTTRAAAAPSPQPGRYARDEAAAPDGHQDGARVGHLLSQLQAYGPLPGYHEGVVEGRDVIRASLGRIRTRRLDGVVNWPGFEADLGPVPAGGVDLGQRCRRRHEYGGG